jgi:hypothetical protein
MKREGDRGREEMQKQTASAEAGQRATASPPRGPGVSSRDRAGGSNPFVGTLGGLGAIGMRGTDAGQRGTVSGQVTNDSQPQIDTAGGRPQQSPQKDASSVS